MSTEPGRRPQPTVELCVGAVVCADEHLLMVRRGTPPCQGQWSLPGGRVDAGETLHQAVVREVREETGLAVVCQELVGWVERISDEHHFVIMDFAAVPLSDDKPVPASDAADARFVPLWEIAELDLVDGLIEFLSDHDIVRTIA